MVRKTKKASKTGSTPALTIPQLRKRFEQLDRFLQSKVAKLDGEKAVEAFRSEWKKLFGKQVSKESARDYLAFVASSSQKTQKGGAVVGAPIDQMTRAGVGSAEGVAYGSFPPFVENGFGFANHDSFIQDCGKPNPFPVPPAGLGSNEVGKAFTGGARKRRQTRRKQKGGGLSFGSTLDEAFQRPFSASAGAPGYGQAAQMTVKGVELPASSPVNNPLSFTTPPTVLNIKIASAP